MKPALLLMSAIARMMDPSLTAAQRNDACYSLRGDASKQALAAMTAALSSRAVRSCAAQNLREADAVDELRQALQSEDAEVRAAAAAEIGHLKRPALLPLVAEAARDKNLLVASNAVKALADYQDRIALPNLLHVARGGGMVAALALGRAATFREPEVAAAARNLMDSSDVSVRLAALSAIAELGDETDLPRLRRMARTREEALSAEGGFQLVPSLDLSRAAQNAIGRIEGRR
ncbi:MAG: HEAT repeat domain-containing protein [Bryobacteraceae bacterium]